MHRYCATVLGIGAGIALGALLVSVIVVTAACIKNSLSVSAVYPEAIYIQQDNERVFP